MKHSLAILPILAVTTLTAGRLAAQGTDEFGPYGYDDESLETPQHSALELRFGPYAPSIDDEFGGASTPYADHFGSDTRWFFGFEYDWQALRIPKVGTLGPGFGFGFTKMEGEAFLADGMPADQTTTLSIMPMYLVGVLRIDAVAKSTPVPIVPYAKLGVGYAMWWTDNGLGVERAPDGLEGEDTSWGTNWALGAMLLLDVFDRRAAANIDSTSGVNNSYVFLEWYNSDLSGFGSDAHMQVGTNTWMAGIAMEL
jgi:hypothetical protein